MDYIKSYRDQLPGLFKAEGIDFSDPKTCELLSDPRFRSALEASLKDKLFSLAESDEVLRPHAGLERFHILLEESLEHNVPDMLKFVICCAGTSAESSVSSASTARHAQMAPLTKRDMAQPKRPGKKKR